MQEHFETFEQDKAMMLKDNSQTLTQRSPESKQLQKRTINVNLDDMTHVADQIQTGTVIVDSQRVNLTVDTAMTDVKIVNGSHMGKDRSDVGN